MFIYMLPSRAHTLRRVQRRGRKRVPANVLDRSRPHHQSMPAAGSAVAANGVSAALGSALRLPKAPSLGEVLQDGVANRSVDSRFFQQQETLCRPEFATLAKQHPCT